MNDFLGGGKNLRSGRKKKAAPASKKRGRGEGRGVPEKCFPKGGISLPSGGMFGRGWIPMPWIGWCPLSSKGGT